jgi:DNA-binding FadR family transcriptional regulator
VHGPARRAMKQSEIVARQISRQIIVEGLAEGTRLPSEKAMVAEYRVGRGTLREALRLLENRGVLSIKTGREGGPIVRRPRPSDLGEAISLTIRFDGVRPEQVAGAQRALAPRLARKAAGLVSPEAVTAMGECLDRMERHVDQPVVFESESRRFSDILATAAGSPLLAILVSAVESVLVGMPDDEATKPPTYSRPDRLTWTALQRRLHEALAAADGEAAAAAAVELVDMLVLAPVGAARNRRGVRGAARMRVRDTGEQSV